MMINSNNKPWPYLFLLFGSSEQLSSSSNWIQELPTLLLVSFTSEFVSAAIIVNTLFPDESSYLNIGSCKRSDLSMFVNLQHCSNCCNDQEVLSQSPSTPHFLNFAALLVTFRYPSEVVLGNVSTRLKLLIPPSQRELHLTNNSYNTIPSA